MKRVLVFVGLLLGAAATAQNLSSINFSYWYNPGAEIEFQMRPVVSGGKAKVLYSLSARMAARAADSYTIKWERRENLTDAQGKPLTPEDSVIASVGQTRTGIVAVDWPDKPWLLVAVITHPEGLSPWYFYRSIDSRYPSDAFLAQEDGSPLLDRFAESGKRYQLRNFEPGKVYGFYYRTFFPAAYPAFSTALPVVDKFMIYDSTFTLNAADRFEPRRPGLYLLQHDTTAARGVAVLVPPSGFPRMTRVGQLAKALIYVTTPDEYAKLEDAGENKTAFDKSVLALTGDKDRARNFMRSYFQRVEFANRCFTAFKEGWKTDRGIVYIIFGAPDEVTRKGLNEIWYYKASRTQFIFSKAGSVFDPEQYTLHRENSYSQTWYNQIDLWRKSRF